VKIQRYHPDSISAYESGDYMAKMVPDDNGPFYKVEDVQPFLEPRPIGEAPKDGTPIWVLWNSSDETDCKPMLEECIYYENIAQHPAFYNADGELICTETSPYHVFMPIPVVPLPPVGEQG